jgi:pimeloyl-ACP methyl ester carboxylesterase
MMKRLLTAAIAIGMAAVSAAAYDGNDWPPQTRVVQIKSSVDGQLQPARFYAAKSRKPRPLVVRLHAWSAHYDVPDRGVVDQCIEEDVNYISPDFRGPNDHPEAMCSPLVISDICDAIDYAIAHGNVDEDEIHIIGGSGGGTATVYCYMRLPRKIKSFTAWASITHILDYYYACKGRPQFDHYTRMIDQATSGVAREGFTPYLDKQEAMRRSPVLMDTPVELRKDSKLFLFHGIHDGVKEGADVPFTHTLRFFNKVVTDFDASAQDILFTDTEMLRWMEWQVIGEPFDREKKEVLVKRNYKDRVIVCLIDAGHSMADGHELDGLHGVDPLMPRDPHYFYKID